MRIKYKNIYTGQDCDIEAKITTDHASSSYGQPVIVLESGAIFDYRTWQDSGEVVFETDPEERELFGKWLEYNIALINRSAK